MKKPYLLFDAGGTIVFPKIDLYVQVAKEYGFTIDSSLIKKTILQTSYEADKILKISSGKFTQEDDRKIFFEAPYLACGLPKKAVEDLAEILIQKNKEKSLWTFTFPWVGEALNILKNQGYGMSVISNADGRVKDIITETGLIKYFEEVFDSEIVGFSKPDPRLFHFALDKLGLRPEECIYTGDIVYIDVLGANRSNIGAIHLDPFGNYTNWPGVHITNITELSTILATPGFDFRDENLFPLLSIEKEYA